MFDTALDWEGCRMTVDAFGGVWVEDPLLLLFLGLAVFAVVGWAHAVGAGPRAASSSTSRRGGVVVRLRQDPLVGSALCEELTSVVRSLAAVPASAGPRRRPTTTPNAAWRKTDWSQGAPRLYRGKRPSRTQG